MSRLQGMGPLTSSASALDSPAASAVRRSPLLGGVLFLLLGFALIAPASAQEIAFSPHATPITNGQVSAQVVVGDTLYLGGSFTSVGPVTGAGVPVDATSGLPSPDFPVINGSVLAALPDGAGGWFLGGQFSSVGTEARNNLAHVQADGTVSSWNPGAGGIVRAIALRSGTLYVGGDFVTLGSSTRNRLGAIDATSGAVLAWNPNLNGPVRALVAGTSVLYVGGQFTTVGASTRNRVAAVSYTSGLADATWNPNANSTVQALWLESGLVYLGGQFTAIGVQTRNRLAVVDATSGALQSWNPNANGAVNALVVNGGVLYAGGAFTSVGGQSRNRIAALSTSTGLATAWNPNAGAVVATMVLHGGDLLVGGDFLAIGGQSRSRIAALSTSTGLATAWNPTAFGSVSVVASAGGSTAFVGGTFNGLGGASRSNLAAVDLTTGAITSWNPGADNPVQAMLLDGEELLVGGNFANLGGQVRNNAAAVHRLTGAVSAWDPNCDGQVSAIAVSGGRVFLGGLFNNVGGVARVNLAAVDRTSGAVVPTWQADADNQVFVLESVPGTLYVGGSFGVLSGALRGFVGAVDPASGAPLSWDPEANGTVRAISAACDRVYLGGFFTSIASTTRNRLASVHPSTGAVQAWNPNANGPVFALVRGPGVVYVGGVLSTIAGQARNRIAAVDVVSALPTSWNPNSNGTVRVVSLHGPDVVLGGAFTSMLGLPSGNLVSLTGDNSVACSGLALPSLPGSLAVVGQPFSASLGGSGGVAPWCHQVVAGALPPGLLLNSLTGALSGSPTAAGNFTFSTSATDSRGCSVTADYALGVSAAPASDSVLVATAALPCLSPSQTTVALPFTLVRADTLTALRSLQVTLQVDAARLRPAVASPLSANLHAGDWAATFPNRSLAITDLGSGLYRVDLSLAGSPCGAVAGGTLFTFDLAAVGPTGGASVAVTGVTASDCAAVPVGVFAGPTGTLGVTSSDVSLAGGVLPATSAGASYSHTLSATGGSAPVVHAVVAGALPAGLTLSLAGVLSGVPTVTGSFAFNVRALTADGCAAVASFTLEVSCGALVITPALLPDGAMGQAYSVALATAGGFAPYTYTVASGSLPSGLSLSSTGLFSGTPLEAMTAVITVQVTDAAGCTATTDLLFDVFESAPNSSVAAVTSGLAVSTAHPCVSVPFVYTRAESVPLRAVSVSFQLDPARLRLCDSPGVSIQTGPMFGASSNSILQVTDDGGGAYTVDFALLGEPCGPDSSGVLFVVDLEAVGPDGLGAITVTRVRSRDCLNQAVPVAAGPQAMLRVDQAGLVLQPTTLPNPVGGTSYLQTITAPGAEAPVTFTLVSGSLPAGLTLAANGTISGTPAMGAPASFVVLATDFAGVTGSRGYSLTVQCPVLAVSPSSLPDAALGIPYSLTLTAPAATGGVTFTLESGELPAGLTLASNGTISGTPLVPGTAIFTVAVADSFSCAGSESYTLSVMTNPDVSTIRAVTAGRCISTVNPLVTVPVVYERGESSPTNFVHVRFRLDPALALATPLDPAASILEGAWLAAHGATLFYVTEVGGGVYDVDLALLGDVCGPDSGGTVFTVTLASAGADGATTVTVVDADARDCANLPLPAVPGGAAILMVNRSAPARIDDLVAAPVTTGNPPGDRSAIQVGFTMPASGTVSLHRAPFGSYPEYDDTGGTLPDSVLAPGGPWTLVDDAVTSPYTDLPPVRGVWHYVAFVTDSCGNRSLVSNRTRGVTDYHLGDVSDGAVRGQGDGLVGLADVSLLGAYYGLTGAGAINSAGVAYLDVGPTEDAGTHSRPLTDDRIDFEDLMLFALNFGNVSSPSLRPVAQSSDMDAFTLEAPMLVSPGDAVQAKLHLEAHGRVQGFSVALAWDPSVVRPVGVSSSGLVEGQGGLVFTPGGARFDAARLGAGGLSASGEVASFQFEVLREGDAAIRIAKLDVRGADNRPLEGGAFTQTLQAAPPLRTLLLAPAPNPARGSSAFSFSLAEPGRAELSLYSIEGRRVRTLVSGTRPAGAWRVVWNGEDDAGRAVAPGVYWARLETAGRTTTRRLVFLR